MQAGGTWEVVGQVAHLLADAEADMIVCIICKGQAPMVGCGPETPAFWARDGSNDRKE